MQLINKCLFLSFHTVSMIQFTQTLFEADEINGEVEICLTKDLETSSRFTVILSPQETVPSPPDTFQARGVCCLL